MANWKGIVGRSFRPQEFKQYVGTSAEKWKTKLESAKAKSDWAQTIATLNDLINRAKAKNK